MSNDFRYSSIHYDKFHKILAITNNHQRAAVLDKLIFWTLNSNYLLPRSSDQRNWFTQTYVQMSEKTKVPISTLKKYMAYFEKEGWLIRTRKKLGENVRAFFRVTNKLLALLGLKKRSVTALNSLQQTGTPRRSDKEFSILKDNKLKDINTITDSKNTKSTSDLEFEKTLENLYRKYRKSLSISQRQFVAEIEYSVNNPNFFKNTKSLRHKINIISKLIREKLWKTPKGFYKYNDVGQELKETLSYLNEEKKGTVQDKCIQMPLKSKLKSLKQELILTTSQRKSLTILSKHDPNHQKGIERLIQREKEIIQQIKIISGKIKNNSDQKHQSQRE